MAGNTGYTYDRNGNLKTLNRNVNNVALDNLAYTYESNRNRLASVADAGTDANDLTNAYTYDEIGNLVSDNADNKTIAWNVYGKVKAVTDNATTEKTEFYYDPSGNRVLKKQVNEVGLVTGTYYVRDASGNVMATYEQIGEGIDRELRLEEQPIYGSDRLVVSQDKLVNLYENKSYLLEEGVTLTLGSGFSVNAAAGETFEARPRQYEEKTLTNEEAMPLAHDEVHNRPLGYKQYELKDHLGNVRAVISDRRTIEQGADELGNPISYYQGELMTYNHYYPFGMDMASWSSDNFSSYRYGFNGREKDDKGEFGSKTTYDYGFRIYNPGIAKFLSVDPLYQTYPFYSPYQFASNTPILAIDIDGLESDKIINEGEKYLGTPYEYGGKKPDPSMIGFIHNYKSKWYNNIRPQLQMLSDNHAHHVEENDFVITVGKGTNWNFAKKWAYTKLEAKGYTIQKGNSYGIDCSAFTKFCYSQDQELLMGELPQGTSNQLKFFKEAAKSNKAFLHKNVEYLSEGDWVYKSGHTMIATGNVRTNPDGKIEIETQEAHSTEKGVIYNWRVWDENIYTIGHPFRTTDKGFIGPPEQYEEYEDNQKEKRTKVNVKQNKIKKL